jgi:hypothetical protein
MAFLTRKGDFAAADEFFRKTFMLPENQSEVLRLRGGTSSKPKRGCKLGRKKDALPLPGQKHPFLLFILLTATFWKPDWEAITPPPVETFPKRRGLSSTDLPATRIYSPI